MHHTLDEIDSSIQTFNPNEVLKQFAYRDQPLDFETGYLTGLFALAPYDETIRERFGEDRDLIERQSIALLCSLHNQSTYRQENSGEQIAGIVAAVLDHDIGRRTVFRPGIAAMDNCGMGGDLYRTPNVSTLAALIAAADGVAMAKHGSPGNTDAAGSSDFLAASGADLFCSPELAANALRETNFTYTEALDKQYKSIHLQSHHAARLAHMNDIIGPMTNPLAPELHTKKIVGINHLIEPKRVAEAYQVLNARGITNVEHGVFVRGFIDEAKNGGIDEVSVYAGGTSVAELEGGHVRTYHLQARDFGIPVQSYEEPPTGREGKVGYSNLILDDNVQGSNRNLVLANAAMAFYTAQGTPLEEGFKRAEQVLRSGGPREVLKTYARITRGDV